MFWYTAALSRHAGPADPMICFPLLYVAVGAGLTCFTLAGFLNRTSIVVGNGEITVRSGPVPWGGYKTVTAPEIRQLFREETISYSRRGSRMSYHLSAVTPEKRKLRVVSNVPGADVALYLEQAIEKALGLEDVRVAGEMPK